MARGQRVLVLQYARISILVYTRMEGLSVCAEAAGRFHEESVCVVYCTPRSNRHPAVHPNVFH
jgi:hypothetical protein